MKDEQKSLKLTIKIEPKFKLGQEIYTYSGIESKPIRKGKIISYVVAIDKDGAWCIGYEINGVGGTVDEVDITTKLSDFIKK